MLATKKLILGKSPNLPVHQFLWKRTNSTLHGGVLWWLNESIYVKSLEHTASPT